MGDPTKLQKVTGRVVGLFTGKSDDIHAVAAERLHCDMAGIWSDRHHGQMRASCVRIKYVRRKTPQKNIRQFTAVSVEEMAKVASGMNIPELKPEWIGPNVVVQGIPDFSKLPSGTRLVFDDDGPVLVVDAENKPCKYAGEVIQRHYPDHEGLDLLFPQQAVGLRGVVGWVEVAGILQPNVAVTAWIPPQRTYVAPEE